MAKQKLFDWNDRYTPDEKSKKLEEIRIKELNRLGIDDLFGTGFDYTDDELEAKKYIMSNKKVPKQLEERLLKTKGNRARVKEGFSMEELEKIYEEFKNDNK